MCGGSTALFIYGYCFYYYHARSDMSGFMQVRAGLCYGMYQWATVASAQVPCLQATKGFSVSLQPCVANPRLTRLTYLPSLLQTSFYFGYMFMVSSLTPYDS